jgi:hypothetical protein
VAKTFSAQERVSGASVDVLERRTPWKLITYNIYTWEKIFRRYLFKSNNLKFCNFHLKSRVSASWSRAEAPKFHQSSQLYYDMMMPHFYPKIRAHELDSGTGLL